MKKKISTIFLSAVCVTLSVCLLTACNKAKSEGTVTEITDVELPSSEITAPAAADMFTDRDLETSYNSTPVQITLNGASATCSDDKVSISGGVITISKKGTYEFSGTLTDGQIIVDTPADDKKKVQIVLNGAQISCTGSAAIYVKSADKVYVTTLSDSSLTSVGAFTDTAENNVDGGVFSKDDIVFNGTAALTVTADGGNGIVGKDDVKFTSGNYFITAGNHGIDANDSVRVKNGAYTIISGKDGIHSENDDDATVGYVYIENGTFDITAAYDGIDATSSLQIVEGNITVQSGGGSWNTVSSTDSKKGVKSDGNLIIYNGTLTVNSADDAIHTNGSLQIDGGNINVSSGDDGIHADSVVLIQGGTINVTKSYEGIEGKSVTIKGGDINVTASDDGINAAGGNDQSSMTGRPGQNGFSTDGTVFVTISGGSVYINAGGDGIDSNGNLYVSGGTVVVEGSTNGGNGALDYDGAGQITGGTVLAVGSNGMAMNFSAATQGAILVNFSGQSAGSKIKLTDGDGNTVVEYTSTKSYSSILVSSPSIVSGGKYTLTAGSYSATISMTGLIYGGGTQMGGGFKRP